MSIPQHSTNGFTRPSELDLPDFDLGSMPTVAPQRPQQPTAVDVTSIFGEGNVPDPNRLQAAIDLAQQALPMQNNEDLRKVLSDDEFVAELEQQRRFRATWREQAELDHKAEIARHQRTREHEDELARSNDEHRHTMATEQQAHEQQLARSARERDRLTDPNVEVRKAQRAHTWLPRLALVPSAVAALVSAANLAIQGARIIEADWSGIGAMVGAGIDAVFTVGLIAITLGRMSGVVTEGWRGRAAWSYLAGEIGIGLGLAAASIIAHHLPSADGTEHSTSQAWWFALLPFMFALSAIYGPKLQADTRKRLMQATNNAKMSGDVGSLSDTDAKVLRLARWIAQQDHEGLIPGERGEDGLPSAKGIEKAVREHIGRCSQPLSRRIRDTYAILSGNIE